MKIIINNNGIIQLKLITKVLFIISKIDLYEKYFSKSPISIQYFNLIWKHIIQNKKTGNGKWILLIKEFQLN